MNCVDANAVPYFQQIKWCIRVNVQRPNLVVESAVFMLPTKGQKSCTSYI
jgi:hypothetical protein